MVHFTGFETFSIPETTTIYVILFQSIISTVIGKVLWLYGTLYTSCLIGTMSLSLQIPLKMIIKNILRSEASTTSTGTEETEAANHSLQKILIGFTFIITAFTVLIYTSSPKFTFKDQNNKNRKLKVPIKCRNICMCLCHQNSSSIMHNFCSLCFGENENVGGSRVRKKRGKTGGTGSILRKGERKGEDNEMKNLLGGESSESE